MRKALLLACLAIVVAVVGCGGGGGNSGGTLSGASKLISHTAGGTITAPSGSGDITVAVPAGALASDTTITVTPTTTAPTQLPFSNTFIIGADLDPDGTSFSSPVTVTFPLPSARTAGTKLLVVLYDSTANPTVTASTTATVNADRTTATFTLTHFSSYLLTGSSVAATSNYFTFSTGADGDSAPADFFVDQGGASITPNHSPAKVSTADYASITQATEGGYSLDQIAIQAGTVIIFDGEVPGDNHYYKVRITSVSASSISFVYEQISGPPSITGEWNLSGGGTLSIMSSQGGDTPYIIDVHNAQGNLTQMAGGSLSGSILSGTWTTAAGGTGGPFTITFNAGFTSFTGSYSGAASGTWTGTK